MENAISSASIDSVIMANIHRCLNYNYNCSDYHEQEHYAQEVMPQDDDAINVMLVVDKRTYQAGKYLDGHVRLYVPQSAAGCDEYSEIHLLLEGHESVELCIIDLQQQYNTARIPPQVEKHQEKIVALDNIVIQLRSPLIPGHYEYPFEWKLPESLPCSMRCKAQDRSVCEVRYHLTAYLRRRDHARCRRNNRHANLDIVSCMQPIRIAAAAGNASVATAGRIASDTSLRALGESVRVSGPVGTEDSDDITEGTVVEPKQFKIKKWFVNKGDMDLGLDTDTTVASPNSTVTVGITGRNRSSVPVKYLLVKWTETVMWGMPGQLGQRQSQRILVEKTITVDDHESWQAQKKHHGEVCDTRFTVPLKLKNARDSYNGRMVQVQHCIQVTAVTKGKCVTKPKSITYMKVKRQANPVRNTNDSSCIEDVASTSIMAQAQLLQTNESIPVGVDELPQATAIFVDPQQQQHVHQEEAPTPISQLPSLSMTQQLHRINRGPPNIVCATEIHPSDVLEPVVCVVRL